MKNIKQINDLLKIALSSLQKNDLETAKNIYNKVLAADPKNYISLNNIGIIYFRQGDINKSIEYFKKVLEINPEYPQTHENLKVIYYNLGKLELSYNHEVEFLKLKSKSVNTNANLNSLIPNIAKKLQSQNHVRTFFDNATLRHLIGYDNSKVDFSEIFEKAQNSKINRFISFEKRLDLFKSVSNKRLYEGLPFLTSQGTHSLFKWKNIPIFKTTYDLSIYMMILEEVKPDYIIELGSGLGGSAIWFADITKALGLKTHVYSLDIEKPDMKHPNVTFIKQDLYNIEKLEKIKFWNELNGKKILIEDAHVNIKNILYFFDKYLNRNDYLIIEDSDSKADLIKDFIYQKDYKYKIDQFYLDFFGTNITCCTNSIFKCF